MLYNVHTIVQHCRRERDRVVHFSKFKVFQPASFVDMVRRRKPAVQPQHSGHSPGSMM